MIFANGRLIDRDGIRDGQKVVVQGGKISEVGIAVSERRGEVIDLAGNYLAPGFIDLHIHGALGRDTMEATEEAFGAICDHHRRGGTTSLLLTTTTAPLSQITAALRAIEKYSSTHPNVLGAHVEGPFISTKRAGAQRADCIIGPSFAAWTELSAFARTIKVMTLAPELPGALELIELLWDKGIVVSGGHSDAWEEDVRLAIARGMAHVTHAFNSMSTARKRGPHRIAGLLEVALAEPRIVCELIADGHHVLPTLMKVLYRAKRDSGICLVTDATAGAGLSSGSEFSLSGRDCVVADGVGLLADKSALAGSCAQMITLVRNLVELVEVPLHEAVGMATRNPAHALGLSKTKGSLAIGADADFVVLSPSLDVVATYVGGVIMP